MHTSTSTSGLDLSSQNLHVCFLVCPACWRAWLGARCLLRSWEPPPSGKWSRKAGSGCTSGLCWSRKKVLEHRLLNVPLGKFLPLSGLRFLCEAPALYLRLRSLIPSHRCIDLCLGWLREASGSGQAVSGWREGCCWGNQALSRVRALDPLGNLQLWLSLILGLDIEELLCPHP